MPTSLPLTVQPSASFVPPGIPWGEFQETVDMSAAAAAAFALRNTIPKGASVISVALSVPTAINATTAVKIGVGRSTATANPSKYLLTADLTATELATLSFSNAQITDAGGESLAIYACATGGTAAGTIGGGAGQYVEVRITYLLPLTIK